MVTSSIKQDIRKEEETYYDVYKENRPTTPKNVTNVFVLGYLGVEKDFSRQTSSIPKRKKRIIDCYKEK